VGISLFYMLFNLIPIGAVVFFGWLGLRFVRARERDSLHNTSSEGSDVRRLEDLVHDLQAEVHSIRERQEFVEKLLERPKD
jgi:hypothetical protein